MLTKLKIISHEFINGDYLRLNVACGNQPCGTIDLIAKKINFNIVGKHFFKGMVSMNGIELEYQQEALVFTFRNRKRLAFNCDTIVFTTISRHVKAFQ